MNSGQTLLFRASANCWKILNAKRIFNTVKNFRANSVFWASASCSKILWDTKYFNAVNLKKYKPNSVFKGKRKLFKILNDKKHILNTVISRHSLFFQGKHKLLKNPECEKHIQYSEKFQGKLCFLGQAQSCSKMQWMVKIFQHSEKFQGNSVFQGKRKLFKILNDKYQWRAVRGGKGGSHMRTGRHFTGGSEKICAENNNLPWKQLF